MSAIPTRRSSPAIALGRLSRVFPSWLRLDRRLNDGAIRNAAVAVTDDLLRAHDRQSAQAALASATAFPAPRKAATAYRPVSVGRRASR